MFSELASTVAAVSYHEGINLTEDRIAYAESSVEFLKRIKLFQNTNSYVL